MSVFSPSRISKDHIVRNTDYIRTENESDDGSAKPAESVNPSQPEAK
jgi:hypothetical protein